MLNSNTDNMIEIHSCQITPIPVSSFSLIYNNYMTADFPPAERKKLTSMEEMYQRGNYSGYQLLEEGKLRAYWFLLYSKKQRTYLLDYLAVTKEVRGKGYGSEALRAMQKMLKPTEYIQLEVENPDGCENMAEREKRERRIAFYKKNGAMQSSVVCDTFGVSYQLLIFGAAPGRERIAADYLHFYRDCMTLSKDVYERNVHIISDENPEENLTKKIDRNT